MNSTLRYFANSLIGSVIGLVLAYLIAGLEGLWIALVLSILEVSLSFDNAVVNAKILKNMEEVWKKRFLTYGMAIAVFGMRFVFPIVIVSAALGINPWAALMLAIDSPDDYAHALESVHTSVMGLGGSFLALVALKFFVNHEKEDHWLPKFEQWLVNLDKIDPLNIFGKFEINLVHGAIVLAITGVMTGIINYMHGPDDATSFIVSSVFGIILYIVVDSLENFIGPADGVLTGSAAKSGLASFVYLEVLDSSFSFDGVLGALALSTNIFIIMIGLGIGALFVRSLTILMVDRGTVEQYRFMENGAFFAIFGLATIMFINTVYEIPEVITGLIGVGFIAASIYSSIKDK